MPSQTSKFPSYGLVRGPSHERGGVAGMVADEQPVELEGGEWIVPKEAVPDYLPALIQMTNTGRMRQAMQNGNSAMDALIASASMQNGISEPKSPMYMGGGMMDEYEEGGVVDVLKKAMAKYGEPVDESLYTPQGGRSMLGMAQKYGITPESLNVDTLSFENPAKYVFGITGETPEGRQVNIGEESRGSLPLKQDVDKAIGEFYKDDLYGKMDAVKSLRSELKGTSTKPQVDRQKEMMMKALNMSESEYDAFMDFKNKNKEQGGMIQYEDGGRVLAKRKLIDDMSESNGVSKGYSRVDSETLDLDTLERVQDIIMERNIGDQYGGIEDALVSRPGSVDMGERRTYANRFDVRQDFGPDGNTSTSREQLSVGSLPVLATLANLASRAGVSGEGVLGRVLNAPLPIERITEDGRTSFSLSREQGGMIGYEDGGEVHSRRMYNQKDKKKYGYEMGGMMPQYQEGGNVLKLRPFDTPSSDEIRQAFKADPLPGSDYKYPFDKEKKYKETGQYWTSEPSTAQLLNWQFSQLPKLGRTKEAEEAYIRGEMRMGSTYKGRKYDVNELKDNARIRKLLGVKEAAEAMGEDGMQAVMDENLMSGRFMKDKLENRMWKRFNEEDNRAILASRREEIPMDMRAPEYRGPSYSWTGVPSLPEVKINPLEKLQYYINKALPKKQGGPVDYYQEGGQVQGLQGLVDSLGVVGSQGMLGNAPPRRQQEIRNPEVYYGPPMKLMGPGLSDYEKAEQKLEAFMDSLQTDSNINPFSGKPIDTDADVKRLFERMKKSKIPRSDKRMVMREGGPIPYQNGGQVKASSMGLKNFGEVTDMPSPFSMSRPEFEAFTNSPMSEEEAEEMRQEQLSNLMSIVGQDMRIRPKQPDRYIVKNGKMSQTEMNIPKLSGAYLSSFGLETPLSRRQRALLQRKMIAPETLNPQVKGLINRALVQRLANEED